MKLIGIDTLIIRVTDLSQSKKWYTEKLGFEIIYETDQLLTLDTSCHVSITLWVTNEPILPNPKTSSYPIFKTDNAEETYRYFQEINIPLGELNKEEEVCYFNFYDPDGNILEVCQVL